MLCNINELFINGMKTVYLHFDYPDNIRKPNLGGWSFYYSRKLFYITWVRSIYKSNKMNYKDENSFFMFHNYIDLNFVKNSFMKIDLVWSFNLFFIYLFYYLFNYIVFIFVITVLFKKMKNILREKKIINFDFFYNWQRLIWEDYDKLTNFETKIFSDFYNKHYAWHKYLKQDENELVLLEDVEWDFDKWTLLENNIRTSLYRMKNDLDDKYYFFAFVYYKYYLSIRFLNINKKVRQMYNRKLRSIRERNQYLNDLNYLLPFNYYKDFNKLKWLRKIDNDDYIWNNLATNFFYNIELKMIFVLSDANFKKFYNIIDILEEMKTHGQHWLDYLHSPLIDGLRDILFAATIKNKDSGEVDIMNDLGISFEKIVLVDIDEPLYLLPSEIVHNINKKLEWLYYMDKKLNNYANFYLYEFWKQDIFMWEIMHEDIDFYYYYGQNNSFKMKKIDKTRFSIQQEYMKFDLQKNIGNMIDKPVTDKFIVHEIKNETLLYLWAFIICFYFFWLICFYAKYTIMTKRQIFHIIKFFWYFVLIFVQFWNMKVYLFLFYNTIYTWKFYNNSNYDDETSLFRIFHTQEWYYLRKLQYELWRLDLKWIRFFQFNVTSWDWKDIYYLQLGFLIMCDKGHGMFYGDMLYNNYWLVDSGILIFILFIAYFYLYRLWNKYMYYYIKI
jgi:hypothetical protein